MESARVHTTNRNFMQDGKNPSQTRARITNESRCRLQETLRRAQEAIEGAQKQPPADKPGSED
jgi:hypothetical protein